VHEKDIVPHIISKEFGWLHSGLEVFVTESAVYKQSKVRKGESADLSSKYTTQNDNEVCGLNWADH